MILYHYLRAFVYVHVNVIPPQSQRPCVESSVLRFLLSTLQ